MNFYSWFSSPRSNCPRHRWQLLTLSPAQGQEVNYHLVAPELWVRKGGAAEEGQWFHLLVRRPTLGGHWLKLKALVPNQWLVTCRWLFTGCWPVVMTTRIWTSPLTQHNLLNFIGYYVRYVVRHHRTTAHISYQIIEWPTFTNASSFVQLFFH